MSNPSPRVDRDVVLEWATTAALAADDKQGRDTVVLEVVEEFVEGGPPYSRFPHDFADRVLPDHVSEARREQQPRALLRAALSSRELANVATTTGRPTHS